MFFYIEFILLILDAAAKIVAIVLLYRGRNRIKNQHQIYIISFICQINQWLYGDTVDNRLAFSVSFEFKIPDSLVFWEAAKIS